jgi:predicted nucleotidyltransferase
MRLSAFQRQTIVEAVREAFGTEAKTFLFGSRTDATKRGGDIDLLVEVPAPSQDLLTKKVQALGRIQRKIGEQKIDLVVTDGSLEQESLLVVRNARKKGVLL